ncbi:MAG: urease accessory protein UreE [Woeseiaceae bacterium]
MVLKVYERLEKISEEDKQTSSLLTLPFELRKKSRLKANLDDGTEVGLILSRGEFLRGGDYLRAENNLVIKIVAAEESVSTIRHDDTLMLMRASYHLGNRHVPLQVNNDWLRYEHDHVLDDMVKGLGLNVSVETAPFEPEAGAYGGGHKHGDDEHVHEHHDHSNNSHSHSH